MNIVNRLTMRQLKLNKRRTLVTIIGTIISVAMITAVATLGLSFMDLMQRQSIASNGEWHAKYLDVNKQQLETIESKKEVKTTILTRDLGYAYLEGSQNQNKPYLDIKEFSKEGYDNFPIDLLEGRLPEREDELIISEEVQQNAKVNYKIGDTIELAIGKRISTLEEDNQEVIQKGDSLHRKDDTLAEYLSEDMKKTYTIVGIISRPNWEATWSPGYTVLSYIDSNTVTAGDTFNVAVIMKKVNSGILKKIDHIASEIGYPGVEYNNDLLRYYGVYKDDSVKKMIYGLSMVIMIIIIIGSVSLIYNAFAISVSERSRYLGMLSSVGATKRQKRNSVFFEGAVIGVISIPIGIAAGLLGLGITYIFINPLLKGVLNVIVGFRLVVKPSSLITSILVAGVTILISTYIPARKASNISAIDAIRQTTDIKIRRKQVRTWKITRKIFGIEGDLALKNMKRNRSRYKATVFSLVISMVLFLVVSSFTQYLKKSLTMTQEGINFDIETMIMADTDEVRDTIIQKIISQKDIKASSIITRVDATTMIDEDSIADYLNVGKEALLTEGQYPYQVTINVLEDKELQKYAKKVGVDLSNLTNSDQIPVIVIDTMKYKDPKKDKYIETKAVKTKVGKTLQLILTNPDTLKVEKLPPVTIAALTDQRPMGVMPLGEGAGFHIIMSQSAYASMIKGVDKAELTGINTFVYLNSKKSLRLQENLESIQKEFGISKLSIYNIYYYKEQEQQSLLLISVFTYAFIILITAICIANIFNTISTSIALRKREFAMLKSVGITPKGFNKMLNFESIFYGIKALIYGLPISILAMYLMYRFLMNSFEYAFVLPMKSILIEIVAVFIIVSLAMLYSGSKVKKENIIDALKQEIV